MNLGIVSRSFPDMTNAEIAKRMKDLGLSVTELCLAAKDSKYWVYNGLSDIQDVSDSQFSEIVDTYRSNGIEVASLGVFTNLIEPEPELLQKNLDSFFRHIELAGKNNIPYAATECGFNPPHRGVQASKYEENFQRLSESLSILCDRAAEYGVAIALEPCVLDVVPSAKRMSDLIEQLERPNLKVLLDPANLIANASEEDMFYYLSEHVAYFHGKDRKVNDAYGRCVGDGDIMWPSFLSLYHDHCEGFPFILEYVNNDNCEEILARVRQYDELASQF